MQIVPFKYEHAEAYPGDMFVDGMYGLTLLRNSGLPCMSGGVADFPWGAELWICTVDDITDYERMRGARIARRFVALQLELEKKIFAHTKPGNERWLMFLGFRLETTLVDEKGQIIHRWQKEE
jgi:hypothetical protein